MRIAKILLLLCTLTITMVIVTGCNPQTSTLEDDLTIQPSKISILINLHTSQVPVPLIEKRLEEKTNTKLEINWVPDSNYEEKLITAFATNTLPEVVYIGANQYDQFVGAIRDERFWEIGSYLKQFENLNKINKDILLNASVDGKIYALYSAQPLSRQGMIFRSDWADNLGLKTPTNIKEFYEMLRAFTEDDPDGNGINDTVGLTDRSDLVYGAFKTVSSWFGTPNNWGIKDGQVLPEFMFPEYIETIDFFKDLYEKGYINKDFPVTSKKDQQDLLIMGKAGVYVGSIGDVGGLYEKSIQINPHVKFDVQNKIKNTRGTFGIWGIPGYGNTVLFPKRSVKTEEDLLGILSFFDYLMTPEGSNLTFWGIEGKHYELVNGFANTIVEQEVYNREVKPYIALQVGEMENNGRLERARINPYPIKEKATQLIEENADFIIHDPTVRLQSDTYINKYERLEQLINDATYQYILGQIDLEGFNVTIDKWRKNGGNDIIAEFTEHYQSISK